MTSTMTRKMQATNEMAQAGNMKAAVEIYIRKYRNIAPKTFAKMAQDKQDEIIAEAQEFCKDFKWGEKKERPMPVVVEEQPEEAPQGKAKFPKKEELAAEVKKATEDVGEFTLTTEGFYMWKLNGCAVKFQLGRGVKIRCNKKAGTVLTESGIEIESHTNWNIPYAVLTEDYKAVITAVRKAAEVKEA